MKFKKYQHIEKFGTLETNGIEFGECYIFPKIDGTNGSIWWNDGVKAGSRNRELTLDNDNQEFYKWIFEDNQDNIRIFIEDHPHLRIFGEWLVPHSLRTYRDSAWRNFYVFDVMNEDDEYLPYEEYKPLLEKYDIEYISPIAIIRNPTYESLIKELKNNTYLIKDGEGTGEGIVIKNYDYKNKFDRQTWAKIVESKFKEKHRKEMGAPIKEVKQPIETKIVDKYVTEHLIEKEYQKIVNEQDGWSSKFIPRLLNTVFYCLVKEENWNFVKEFKNPIVNYKTLQFLTFSKVKQIKRELF
jgi:hypothetical protein